MLGKRNLRRNNREESLFQDEHTFNYEKDGPKRMSSSFLVSPYSQSMKP